jgi:hypothetical protein
MENHFERDITRDIIISLAMNTHLDCGQCPSIRLIQEIHETQQQQTIVWIPLTPQSALREDDTHRGCEGVKGADKQQISINKKKKFFEKKGKETVLRRRRIQISKK